MACVHTSQVVLALEAGRRTGGTRDVLASPRHEESAYTATVCSWQDRHVSSGALAQWFVNCHVANFQFNYSTQLFI